jgi:hypothetical protein
MTLSSSITRISKGTPRSDIRLDHRPKEGPVVLTVVAYLRDDDHTIRRVGGVYTQAWRRLAESGNPVPIWS